MTSRVTLYTRMGCHLCDDARAIVADVCEAAEVDYHEVDIDSDPALRAQYTDEIPVVTVDGEMVGFWRIDPEVLRSAIT